jgi:hypothetical protein
MTDYLAHLAERVQPGATSIQPAIPSRFEPSPITVELGYQASIRPEGVSAVEQDDLKMAEPAYPKPPLIEERVNLMQSLWTEPPRAAGQPGVLEVSLAPVAENTERRPVVLTAALTRLRDEPLNPAHGERRQLTADASPARVALEKQAAPATLPSQKQATPAALLSDFVPQRQSAPELSIQQAVARREVPRSQRTIVANSRHFVPELPHAPHTTRAEPDPQTPPVPSVHVTIGRVEVRAVMSPLAAPPKRPVAPPGPKLSLEEYLRARNGGLA